MNSHTIAAMDPQSLLATIENKKLPPVQQWNPELCGDIDIRIARDGTWYHEGTPIRRQRMVELFATILRRDNDGEYYLVTPVEKMRIQVEDAPFIAIDVDAAGTGQEQLLLVTTNVGDRIVVDDKHPLRVEENPATGEPSPYVLIRDALEARINRPSFYRLVELALMHQGQTGVWSQGVFFPLEDGHP